MNSIQVKGFKSLRDTSLLLRPINLLIGENGAGKSNLLALFDLLGNAYNRKLAYYTAKVGSVDKLLFRGRKTTERICLKITNRASSYDITLLHTDGKLIVEQESLNYTGKETIVVSHLADELGLKSYSGHRGNNIKKELAGIRVFHFNDTGITSPFSSDCHITNDSYFLYDNGSNMAAILYKMCKAAPKDYLRLVNTIQSVAPYFLDFYFQPTEADTLRLQWQDKYSSSIYGPADFSDGTIRFIALAVLFLQPNLPKVIIIDEPELGLHPLAVEKLSGFIKVAARRGSQIIIATQSAELISCFEPDDVLTVNQTPDGTSIERLNNKKLAIWLDDYTLGDLWKQNIVKGGPR